MSKKTPLVTVLFILSLLFVGCHEKEKYDLITTKETQLIKHGQPYHFIGCNIWYASIIGSTGQGGNRERLCHELDELKALGITNVRILTGPDAGSVFANPARPYLQESGGTLNDTILEGLDYTLAELEKRDMDAVIYLNNAWDWSGGYGYYLKASGYGDSPNANVEGGYKRYVDYCANFSRDTCAQSLYYKYIEQIVSRRNSITGRLYRDEPSIMAWQLCNEPRPFARDEQTKEMFAQWIARSAALIKSIDPNHLVSTGSEGAIGCETDMELCERIHSDPNIDYLTIHIWPVNWGWASRTNPDGDIANACTKSSQYIARHVELARRIGKPLVIEEFGYSRQGNKAGVNIPTDSRDQYYNHIFNEVKNSISTGGPIAGCNFWGWSGSARPNQEVWQPGEEYLCDPPHEPQGWYSVFNCDTTTIEIIRDAAQAITHAQLPTSKVNPFIGTTNYGTTHPGAVTPNGMMSVVPFNVMGSDLNLYDKDHRWWSAPYEHTNKYFTGYAHVALSGVGCPEASSLLVMPTTGNLDVDYLNYGSEYTKEKASPGYYTNRLTKYNITTEVTSTPRTSCERYTFPKGKGHILLNLGQGLTNESGAMVRCVNSTEIEGMKLMGTFCYTTQAVFPIYFVMRVSRTPSSAGPWKYQPRLQGVESAWSLDDGTYKCYDNYRREIAGDNIGYYFSYDDLSEGEQIIVQMGVSFVSIENARMNLEAEQQGKDFDRIHAAAVAQWENDLSRIRITGGTPDQQTVFYTALYHSLIHPSIISDVNGEYPQMESESIGKADYTRYSVFSLWDTYRNLHPLLTLVYPERQTDMLRTLVDMYREWKWLPRWELFGRETYTMEGDPSAIVIADSWVKGLRDFDIHTAYEAMLKSATTEGKSNLIRPDIDPYINKGYIPVGYFQNDLSGDNSVSHALEYCMADFAIAQLADSLGDHPRAEEFMRRSQSYRRYYNKEYGTLRPLTSDGSFLNDFDPSTGKHFENVPGFHEGSAWAYTFAVPHDIEGLTQLMGGQQRFIQSLQGVFDNDHYDPANEPDIAYPYLFSRFEGEEWRTQKEVKHILDRCYLNAPYGIPGNDDTGTMSAWAVFSMMGLYPDCPGTPYYTLTTPIFDKVSITTQQGSTTILTHCSDSSCCYIDSITLNGKRHSYRIKHQELLGSTIQIVTKE